MVIWKHSLKYFKPHKIMKENNYMVITTLIIELRVRKQAYIKFLVLEKRGKNLSSNISKDFPTVI